MKMKRFMFATTLALSLGVAVQGATNVPVTAPAPGPAAGDAAVVLDETTVWRQYQVGGPSRVRQADGGLIKWYIPWRAQTREFPHNETVDLKPDCASPNAPDLDAPLPPADWAALNFDDTGWPRSRLPQPEVPYAWVQNSPGWSGQRPYNTVILLMRGKFEIKNPAEVKACVLSLNYWGGVAVYINGKEVVRQHLPAAGTNLAVVAEDYPVEVFTTPEGKPLRTDAPNVPRDRLALRDRKLRDVGIPVALLRPGMNVIAIEAHQAPVSWKVSDGRFAGERATGWPPIGVLHASVSVMPSDAVPVSGTYPRGIRMWNGAPYDTTTVFDYGEPGTPVRPILIRAARNSVFSGRLMVGSDQPIKGLKAMVGDLFLAPESMSGSAGGPPSQDTDGGNGKASRDGTRSSSNSSSAKIPASAVRVRYAVPASEDKSWVAPYRFDGLLDAIPAEIPVAKAPPAGKAWEFYHYRVEQKPLAAGAVAPLWFTVRVPKEAKAGVYEGKVTVAAVGLPATTVPLRVQVCDWTMPDPKDFRIQNFLYHAEEVHAKYYGVTNYSDRHLELVGRTLTLAAELNSRQVNANLACEYFGQGGGGNPESLVRWIKQPDGSFKHDFTNFDRYLDMVAKAIGKPRTLRLNCFPSGQAADRWPGNQPVTLFDPATGKLDRMDQPPAGSAEHLAFWRPVIEEVIRKIKARGWSDETTFGMNIWSGWPAPSVVDVAHKLWPEGEWSWHGHAGVAEETKFLGVNTNVAMTVRHVSCVWDTPSGRRPPLWELDRQRRNTFCCCPRAVLADNVAPLREVRRMVERYALNRGFDGLADFGLDLFPLKRPVGGYMVPPAGRGTHWQDAGSTLALLYPGPDGAVATERYEMFREGLELCEAVVFVRKAIADKKLSADLQQRADRYVRNGNGDRFKAVDTGWFIARYMQTEEDEKLLSLAGEVARAMGSEKK
jgi:hypothetical protein